MARRSITTSCLEETEQFAKHFAKALVIGDVVCFYGDLGSGKTTFIKTLVSQITNTPINDITSPTFNYCHSYTKTSNASVHHLDLYRLQSKENFITFGFDELINPNSICFIEWSERIEDLIPASAWKVHMKVLGTTIRKIAYENHSLSKGHISFIGS